MNQNDCLNDLFDYGYKIYQNDDYFKFSLDSVLLAEFVDIKMNQKNVLDLCSGNAPIPMILNRKFNNSLNIVGIELQKEIFELGKNSLDYNKLENIKYINDDINNASNYFSIGSFDVVTCNPPYFIKYNDNNINDNSIKAIARHEITTNLNNVVNIAKSMLKTSGYFYMVHRPERIVDIIEVLNKNNFGIKTIKFIYNDKDSKNAVLVLIESMKNGKNYVKIDKPLFLKEHNSYKNIVRSE